MAIPSEQSGLSQLHVACLNGDFEKVVVAVQTRPETLDLTTVDGATPLMLASLMSHYDIVQFLVVVKSAKISKSNSRNQMKAVDYARDDDVTKLMRAEYIAAGFKENALAASKRQEILGLLESPARRSILKNQHSRGGDFKYHEYKLAKIGTKIGVYGLVGVVETGMPLTRNKTIGMIMPMGDDLPTLSLFSFADHAENAAAPGPTIYATSGWKTDERRAPQVVDSELWCSVAHLLGAKLVGHKFKTGQRDNGALPPAERHKGRGAACHVEVLLATMYAYSLTEGLVARQPGQTEEDYIKNQLFRLKKIKSLDLGKRRCMVIYIDSYACDSCRSYVAAMGLRTGLFFQIREGCGMGPPLRLGGNRRDVYGDIWPDEDAEDADLEAALRADPALMDGHRYRLERDATASRSPGKAPPNSYIAETSCTRSNNKQKQSKRSTVTRLLLMTTTTTTTTTKSRPMRPHFSRHRPKVKTCPLSVLQIKWPFAIG